MYKLEVASTQHATMLYAAALIGVDLSPYPGAVRYIGYGNTNHGYGPICVLDVAGTEYVAEPHVTWLPWVSAAEKMRSFMWAVRHLAETREVYIVTEKKEIAFFEHFVKRRFLRKVGYLKNIPIIEEAHMYQYERDLDGQNS